MNAVAEAQYPRAWLVTSEARSIARSASEAKEAGEEMALCALALTSRLEPIRKRLADASDELLAIARLLQSEIDGAERESERDTRPYHERRREMAHCPECGDPECFSLVCDEPKGADRDE